MPTITKPKTHLLLIALALFFSCSAIAADPVPPPAPAPAPAAAPDPAARLAKLKKIADSITYRQGETVLGRNLAKISVPEKFRYLDAKDTGTVLTALWGNPKSDDLLGAIVPVGFDPIDGGGWIVVITYADDGHVKDDDAAGIDYSKLLTQMKDETKEASKERAKEGYGSVELIGWAKPPHYDATAHKLHWAKELHFAREKGNTLNYNIRMLGRGGVLVLNAVAGMDQLSEVEAATPAILNMVNFQEGQRYADFKPSTDKVATYGLAALVAGGIAAKAGLFKLLWVGILAFKKFVVIAVIAIVAYVKKLIAWIRGRKAREVDALRAPTDIPPAA